MTPFRRRSILPLVLVLVSACGGGGTEPPAPASVVAVSTNPLASAAVGTVVATAPTFEVRTSGGTAIAGVPVSVTVTAGGGQLVGAPSVSLAGPTSVGQWTLGTASGPQSVTITVAGIAPLVFTAPAIAGPATQFVMTQGNAQFGTQSTTAWTPLQVRARDQFSNAVVGVSVTWAIDAGGGSLAAPPTTVTDANGVATAPAWTLGTIAAGQQAVLATLGLLTARFTATAQLAPASLTVETSAPASATVFTQLAPAPSFAIRDANGTALAGVPVNVALSAGNGLLTSTPSYTVAGPTTIGVWRLGTTAGTQSVTVSVPVAGFAPQLFTVSATPDVPASVLAVQGANQIALAGATVPITPKARVSDQFGNVLAGRTVQWAVFTGGGALGGSASTSTDASGVATSPAWTLGKNSSGQTLTATHNGITLQFLAAVQTDFNIDLRFVGTAPSGAVALAFQDAVSRVTAMIVADLTNVQIGSAATPFAVSQCNASITGTTLNEIVEDVVIYAKVEAIDGVGLVLGSAGPCLTRTTGGLTALGTMRFDSADLDNLANQGRLADVILHEMLHVVGIGTLWQSRGILADSSTATVRVTGPLATAACVNDGGTAVCVGSVPAENCLDLPPSQSCGVGTRNSHWKESIFRSELMTGYTTGVNPLSRMTIQSLADMGYGANQLVADSYTVGTLMAGAALLDGAPLLALPEPLLPRFTVDAAGRIRPIPR